MPELTEPWDDPDAERDVLLDLVFPEAQAQYAIWLQRWSTLDAKAFGVLAIAVAVSGGLIAARDSLHAAWWAAVVGCVAAGTFFVLAIRRRRVLYGPDLVDFHDEARVGDQLYAARLMIELLTDASASAEKGYEEKGRNFEIGLAILAVAVIGCLPIVLFRP